MSFSDHLKKNPPKTTVPPTRPHPPFTPNPCELAFLEYPTAIDHALIRTLLNFTVHPPRVRCPCDQTPRGGRHIPRRFPRDAKGALVLFGNTSPQRACKQTSKTRCCHSHLRGPKRSPGIKLAGTQMGTLAGTLSRSRLIGISTFFPEDTPQRAAN